MSLKGEKLSNEKTPKFFLILCLLKNFIGLGLYEEAGVPNPIICELYLGLCEQNLSDKTFTLLDGMPCLNQKQLIL